MMGTSMGEMGSVRLGQDVAGWGWGRQEGTALEDQLPEAGFPDLPDVPKWRGRRKGVTVGPPGSSSAKLLFCGQAHLWLCTCRKT